MSHFFENISFCQSVWKTVPYESITLWNHAKSKMIPNAIKHYEEWLVHEKYKICNNIFVLHAFKFYHELQNEPS